MSSPQQQQPTPVAKPAEMSKAKVFIGVILTLFPAVLLLLAGVALAYEGAKLGLWFLLFSAGIIVGAYCLITSSPTTQAYWKYIDYLEKKHAAEKAADQQRYDELMEKAKPYLMAVREYELRTQPDIIAQVIAQEFGTTSPDDKPAN